MLERTVTVGVSHRLLCLLWPHFLKKCLPTLSEWNRKKEKTLAFFFRVVYLFYFSSLWFWQRWMCLLGAISHQQTNSSADFRCWLSPAACLEQKRCPSAHRVLAFVDVGSHADNTFLLVTHSSWSLSTIYIVSTFIHSLSAYPYKC